jgi:hypothetical protein
VSFFDQPPRVTRFKLVHAVWRRQRMEVLWPERGIPPSRVEVDGAAVLGAADLAVRLWANDPYCSAD